MLYDYLEDQNCKVSKICLGTMTFGEQTSKAESLKILDFAFDKGINFLDTAEMYPIYPKSTTQGDTERIIGDWIKKRKIRDKIVIASKIASSHPVGQGFTKLKWIRGGGENLKFDKKNLNLAIDQSLKRLKTDYIDLYQLHWPERDVPVFGKLNFEYNPQENDWTPILEVLNNLKELKRKGKIRHFGLSNETAWGITKFIYSAEKNNLIKPITVQNGYNLLNRVFDISNSEISIRENCKLLAYSPLAGGRLTGKYLNKKKPKNARYTLWPRRFSRHHTKMGEKAIFKYKKLADKNDIKISQMSLAFVLSRPFVLSSIIGVTSLQQLKENLKSLNIKLSNSIINDIEKIHLSYPNPCV